MKKSSRSGFVRFLGPRTVRIARRLSLVIPSSQNTRRIEKAGYDRRLLWGTTSWFGY